MKVPEGVRPRRRWILALVIVLVVMVAGIVTIVVREASSDPYAWTYEELERDAAAAEDIMIENQEAAYLEAFTFMQSYGTVPSMTEPEALNIGYATCDEVGRLDPDRPESWASYHIHQVFARYGLVTYDTDPTGATVGELAVTTLRQQHTDRWFGVYPNGLSHMWDPEYWTGEGQ